MTSCAGRIAEEYRTCKNEKNKQADFRERRCGNEDGRNSGKNKNISGGRSGYFKQYRKNYAGGYADGVRESMPVGTGQETCGAFF